MNEVTTPGSYLPVLILLSFGKPWMKLTPRFIQQGYDYEKQLIPTSALQIRKVKYDLCCFHSYYYVCKYNTVRRTVIMWHHKVRYYEEKRFLCNREQTVAKWTHPMRFAKPCRKRPNCYMEYHIWQKFWTRDSYGPENWRFIQDCGPWVSQTTDIHRLSLFNEPGHGPWGLRCFTAWKAICRNVFPLIRFCKAAKYICERHVASSPTSSSFWVGKTEVVPLCLDLHIGCLCKIHFKKKHVPLKWLLQNHAACEWMQTWTLWTSWKCCCWKRYCLSYDSRL